MRAIWKRDIGLWVITVGISLIIIWLITKKKIIIISCTPVSGGNSCCHNFNIRNTTTMMSTTVWHTENRVSECDPAEGSAATLPHLLICSHSSHWWDLMQQITIILLIPSPFCTPSYTFIVTMYPSLSLDKWWEDWQGSMVVIHTTNHHGIGLVIKATLTSSGRACLPATMTHRAAEQKIARQEPRENVTHTHKQCQQQWQGTLIL